MSLDTDAGTDAYAAVVLYYRAGEVLRTTLAALLGQSKPPSEVVVVDNASDDGIARSVVEGRPGVSLVSLSRNGGYSAGMTAGIAALDRRTPRVLLLTHETTLEHDCAEQLVHASRDGGAVAAGPVLTRQRDGSVWSAGGAVTERGRAVHLPLDESAAVPYLVDWLDGAAVMVDRRALAAIGGLDPRYFLYWEDVDLGLRIASEGAVLCVPSARASQETGTTPPYFASRNRILLWRSHRDARRMLVSIASEAKQTVGDLARGRVRDAAARGGGVVDGITTALHAGLGRVRSPL